MSSKAIQRSPQAGIERSSRSHSLTTDCGKQAAAVGLKESAECTMSSLQGSDSDSVDQSAVVWTEEEKQQELIRFRPPQFLPPYPLEINPGAEKGSRNAYEWLLKHGAYTMFPPKDFAKIVEADLPALGSRIYSDAEPEGHDWGCKFIAWLFVLDDVVDESDLGMVQETSLQVFLELHLVFFWTYPDAKILHQNLETCLDTFSTSETREKCRQYFKDKLKRDESSPVDRVYGGKLGPVGSLLRNLWVTCVEKMSDEFNLRFALSLQEYFLGNVQEAKNRELKTAPSVEEYVKLRRDTGAFEPTLVIVDLVYQVNLSNELYYSPPMQRFRLAMKDIICWHNDSWSFKKEVSFGDIHNLVLLVSRERKVSSYMDASLIVREMIYDRIKDFEAAASDLLAIASPHDQHVVQTYIKVSQHWISGTEDWHSNSSRYQ